MATWKDALKRTVKAFKADKLTDWAAALTYYGVLAIFPALLVVLCASVVLGWLLLLPDEYKQLGRQVAAGAGFAANLLFWSQSGYFDTQAAVKPPAASAPPSPSPSPRWHRHHPRKLAAATPPAAAPTPSRSLATPSTPVAPGQAPRFRAAPTCLPPLQVGAAWSLGL